MIVGLVLGASWVPKPSTKDRSSRLRGTQAALYLLGKEGYTDLLMCFGHSKSKGHLVFHSITTAKTRRGGIELNSVSIIST